MEIKIIDLFNKIANGEEVPKEIKVLGNTYVWNELERYYREKYYGADLLKLCDSFSTSDLLKAEAEIIEEGKTIKEFDFDYNAEKLADIIIQMKQKINELVKEINKLKEK